MRRKPGSLLPSEVAILAAGVALHNSGEMDFHGYFLARHLRDATGARKLVGYGTLYKALDRLEGAGLVTSRWEDPEAAVAESRPRRRLYQVTAAGSAIVTAEAVRTTRPGELRLNPEVTG